MGILVDHLLPLIFLSGCHGTSLGGGGFPRWLGRIHIPILFFLWSKFICCQGLWFSLFLSLVLLERNHTLWADIDCTVRPICLVPLVWPSISFLFIYPLIVTFPASRVASSAFGEGSFRSGHALSGLNLFSSSCHSSEGHFSSLFQGANPTAAISVLYSTFLTSPRAGAVLTAIKSTSSSPASAKTDEAAFLEATRALHCASGFILAEIASNQCTKLLIGVALVPLVLLTSPLAITCPCCHSSASEFQGALASMPPQPAMVSR